MLDSGALGAVPLGLWLVAAGVLSVAATFGLLVLAIHRFRRALTNEDGTLRFSSLPEVSALLLALLPLVVFQASWRLSLGQATLGLEGQATAEKAALLTKGLTGLLDGGALFTTLTVLPALLLPPGLTFCLAAHWRSRSPGVAALGPISIVLGGILGLLTASLPVLGLTWLLSLRQSFEESGLLGTAQPAIIVEEGLKAAGLTAQAWLPMAGRAYGAVVGLSALVFIRARVPTGLRVLLILVGVGAATSAYLLGRPYFDEQALEVPAGELSRALERSPTVDLVAPEQPPSSVTLTLELQRERAFVNGQATELAALEEAVSSSLSARDLLRLQESARSAVMRVAPDARMSSVGSATSALARFGFSKVSLLFDKVTRQERPILGAVQVIDTSAAEVELGAPPADVTKMRYDEKRDALALLARGASVRLTASPDATFDGVAPLIAEARSRALRVFLGSEARSKPPAQAPKGEPSPSP